MGNGAPGATPAAGATPAGYRSQHRLKHDKDKSIGEQIVDSYLGEDRSYYPSTSDYDFVHGGLDNSDRFWRYIGTISLIGVLAGVYFLGKFVYSTFISPPTKTSPPAKVRSPELSDKTNTHLSRSEDGSINLEVMADDESLIGKNYSIDTEHGKLDISFVPLGK